MLKKCGVLLVVFLLAAVYGAPPVSAEESSECVKRDQQVTGESRRYSMHADVNGFAAYERIDCSIKWRTEVLCAMEQVAFDSTSRAFDYYSGREIAMSGAYFVIVKTDSAPEITAFANKEEAEKYVSEHGSGEVVAYGQLITMNFE